MEGSIDTSALETYNRMRDFEQTSEPAGEVGSSDGEPRFVVQEHHARRLHWDFRLERDGVMVSWAVPKGIPPDPKVNHLAVHTEDHPISYNEFEGEIPAGNYGAGTVKKWDEGTYEVHEWEPGKVVVTLHGTRVQGRYALFRTKGDQWMIHRMDPPQDPTREPMPNDVRAMRATGGSLPARNQDAWGYEVCWPGRRALAYVDGGRVVWRDADATDLPDKYPELRPLGRQVGSRQVILDGVLTGFDADGRPSVGALERRDKVSSDSALRRAASDAPITFVMFDLVWVDGHPLFDTPYQERRSALDALELKGPAWHAPGYHMADGAAVLEAVRGQGLPGLVAKRLDSNYEPGTRSPRWIEVKA